MGETNNHTEITVLKKDQDLKPGCEHVCGMCLRAEQELRREGGGEAGGLSLLGRRDHTCKGPEAHVQRSRKFFFSGRWARSTDGSKGPVLAILRAALSSQDLSLL